MNIQFFFTIKSKYWSGRICPKVLCGAPLISTVTWTDWSWVFSVPNQGLSSATINLVLKLNNDDENNNNNDNNNLYIKGSTCLVSISWKPCSLQIADGSLVNSRQYQGKMQVSELWNEWTRLKHLLCPLAVWSWKSHWIF